MIQQPWSIVIIGKYCKILARVFGVVKTRAPHVGQCFGSKRNSQEKTKKRMKVVVVCLRWLLKV